ncbi:hypothetical protein [Arthrobacter sp. BPSS-3]|uniref:CG0192-related protein n=1 Tax=Arthrobacter sp. BPSS-3 TaxID=3366580 RepID=UPI0037DCA8B2
MAIIHQATLTPSKMELLERWLPGRSWFPDTGSAPEKAGHFRFDDPEGEVGLETILVHSGGAVFQVPLSYRGAPLPGADDHLVGTMEHSVLGSRWVYDACADPTYVRALAAAILAGTPQAQHVLQVDGGQKVLPESVTVHGTGTAGISVPEVGDITASDAAEGTVIRAGALEILVYRRLDPAVPPAARSLVGTWEGQDTPVALAAVTEG